METTDPVLPARAFVRRAIRSAHQNALRMSLLHATGDERFAAMTLARIPIRRGAQYDLVVAKEHEEELWAAAEDFLLTRAAAHTVTVPTDSELKPLMENALARPLDDEEYEFRRATLAFDEAPMSAEWSAGRPEIPAEFHVLVIGAGFSGIAMGVQLRRLGIPFTILERRHEVGGTWSVNTYPDARVDTLSSTYEYSFEKNYPWTEYFARQDEVRGYIEYIARKHGVFDHIQFGHDAADAVFDEERDRWTVTVRTEAGELRILANVVVGACGLFATPSPLEIDGIDEFPGDVVHTTGWTKEHRTASRRVAIIGNGSTGVQLLSRVAQAARQVHVFQRTPQWISPRERYGDPVEPETRWLLDTMPHYWHWLRLASVIPAMDSHVMLVPDADWRANGGRFNERNDAVRDGLISYMTSKLGPRQDLLPQLVPDYPPLARRMVVDNGWYESLSRDNVELVTDPIARFDGATIVTSDGRKRDVDLVVAATGFRVTRYLAPLTVRGLGGATLDELWDGPPGPQAYLGLTMPGFPNFFTLYGPNSQPSSGGRGLPTWMEAWAGYVAQCVVLMLEQRLSRLVVRRSVFDIYNEDLDREARKLIWLDPIAPKRNYYVNEYGRLQVNVPWDAITYHRYLRKPRLEDFETR